uniref:Trichohyalin-like n=1 Tax=Phallusia mammillata TaxID=59560 RepID=A0A6F9D807_9ASCI|nr:trichohyalin-like [Phallusia mammillata]
MKYDVLRSKLWSEVAKSMKLKSGEDTNSAIKRLIEEEKSARNKTDEQRALFDKLNIMYSSHDLFGPLPSAFRTAGSQNSDAEKMVTLDEAQLLDHEETNIITDLERRCDDEIRMSSEVVTSSTDSGARALAEVAKQKWMTSMIDSDVTFTSSAVDLVTLDRYWSGKDMKTKLRQDLRRQVRSAQERFQQENPFNEKPFQEFDLTNHKATSALQLLSKSYPAEWTKFRNLLSDVTAQELREASSLMTSDERVTRLAEINGKRRKLDITTEDGKEDLLSLLEEASALKHVSRQEILRQLAGEASDKDVGISLLADLQEEQLKDAIKWFERATQVDTRGSTSPADEVQTHMDLCENIFAVLCKYEGLADDEHLLQALEDKYDALRDKVLMEALMRQLGEDEWNRMSEKERQARLMKLKMEERRLRRKGKYDELAKLLGDAFANEKKLKGLMGLSREEYERRLKERLEARKRGDVIPEEDEESLEEESGINNPLVDLTSRFEDERDALMRLLNGQDDLYLSEKERQRELVRLRQARLRAIEEERYESAAIVSGLIDREAKNRERLKSDKERQRELARRRLEEMRKKRSGKMVELGEEDAKIVDVEDRDLMEEAVLKKLHAFFNWERSWMNSALVKMSDPFEEKEKTSTITIRHRLSGISDHVPRGEVVLQDYYSHLVDAAFYRQVGMSIREEELRSRGDLDAALLAELQEIQDAAEAKLTSKMPDMSNEDLVNEQKRIVSLFKAGKSRNVPESVLTADFGGNPNREIVDALKSQFDAIIDVIAARVLPLKVGENNWEKMSRDEREAKIAHLSSSVKELIEAGRYDDALALLGDGLTDEEKKLLMSLLLGDAEERRKADEAERMARKRERMSDGMSKVDALELFKEEAERFEEQEKKRRKNVLEGLVSDFNNERDALLLALKQARDQAEADKRRQAYLTKLRLQERKLRRENDLSSVAHLLALSRIHDNAMDKEKQRQLALARERLEAYKRRKEAGLSEEKEDSSELNLSSDDVTVLADAVLREMEAKHADERKTLMQILESTAPDSDIRQRADKSSSAERRERVKDLREMRRQWRNEDPQTLVETRDEQMEILKEASALQLSSLSINKKLTEADMEAYILADLQNVQRNEENVLLDGLLDKTAVVLRKLAQVQRQARADGWCDNVAGSLLGLEDAHQRKEEEEEVLRALEDKYDLLKDKLLAEALMKRLGESEWKNLSEQERQRRITQIKMQEKKLRRQGKHDDVAKLFRMLAINEKDVSRLFGEQKSSQQEDLKKRIAELIAERKKQGLSVEDDAIEKALEDEERLQRKTRKNVLLTLDRNLESEREALLASLRRQDEAISEERRRQLAVARLRRDRRQMEAEEKYSAVALVFQSAKQDEAALSASFEESRKRQHELAKARLSARRAQRKRKEAMAALTDPKKILEKLEMIAQEKKQGPPAERLLTAIAMKHEEERETLMLILLAAEDGPDEKNAKKMNDEKLKDAVEEFRTKRKAWRQDRLLRAIKDGTDRILTDEERKRLSNYVAEENKQMVSTVAVLLESKRRAGDVQGDVTKDGESTSIEWLAQLQHTQENEAKFTSEVIAEKSDEYLDVLTDNQRRSRREGWNDNIGKVVFNLDLPWQEAQRPASAGSLDQEAQESLQKMEDEMGRAEEDLEKEKQEIERKKAMGEDIDTDAEFSKLEKQYEARKALLSSDMEKQKAKIREKLMERRQRKDESEFEAHAAAGMVLLADERMKSRDARSKEQATKQRSLMEERLAARREKRRQEQEKLAQEIGGAPEESQTERESKPNTPLGGDRPATLAVPEVDKDKVVAELMRASRIISEQAARDRQRHLEQVRSRIRNKKDKKQSEAVQFIQAYQSEKTILDMRESMRISRQKTMLSERVEKLKTERTMTMKEGGKKKATDFSNLVDKKEVEGLDEDDRMTRIAEKLQKKLEQEKKDEILKEEEEAASTSRQLTMVFENVDADPIRPRTSSRKFEKSDKDQILKERMQRRKNKREREAASVDPDKDDS